MLLVVLLAGWITRGYFKEQYYWRRTMGPSVLTAEQEKEKAAKPGSEFSECANGCPTMVVVPAGKFMMGSTSSEIAAVTKEHPTADNLKAEGPQHEVTIAKPFAVGRTEVTFAEWDACVHADACTHRGDNLWGRDNRPVMYVSWDDAKHYVAWLSKMTGKEYRLLTEAEWEYAARAGSQTRYSFGDDAAELGAHAGYNDNSEDQTPPAEHKTHPVGNKKRNAFGLYDMHGNVMEWVEDAWHEDYEGAPGDGSAWKGMKDKHVVRGGSWGNAAIFLRVSHRLFNPTDGYFDRTGFRLARTLT
jgi:formylglycine-generating enzyme required for sulfatase activity